MRESLKEAKATQRADTLTVGVSHAGVLTLFPETTVRRKTRSLHRQPITRLRSGGFEYCNLVAMHVTTIQGDERLVLMHIVDNVVKPLRETGINPNTVSRVGVIVEPGNVENVGLSIAIVSGVRQYFDPGIKSNHPEILFNDEAYGFFEIERISTADSHTFATLSLPDNQGRKPLLIIARPETK